MTDAIVIVVVLLAATVLQHFANPLWWLLVIVAAHFFLFCNVFRVRRRFELIWATLFIVNVATWLLFGNLNWINVVASQFPIGLACIIAEIRSPDYHGIFARTRELSGEQESRN